MPEVRKHEWRWQAREQRWWQGGRRAHGDDRQRRRRRRRRQRERRGHERASDLEYSVADVSYCSPTATSLCHHHSPSHRPIPLTGGARLDITHPIQHHQPRRTPASLTGSTSDKAKQYLSCSRPLPRWIEVPVPPTATHTASNSAWQSAYLRTKSLAPRIVIQLTNYDGRDSLYHRDKTFWRYTRCINSLTSEIF